MPPRSHASLREKRKTIKGIKMKIKAVLFDLDGTLLPLDQDEFSKTYLNAIARSLAPHGYEPQSLVRSILHAIEKISKSDGTKTNEQTFWEDFCQELGERAASSYPLFEEFYEKEFDNIKSVCSYSPKALEAVELVRKLGAVAVLATSPLFPSVATEKRMAWAGLSPSDFEFFTTYENSHYCKPSLDYYREVCAKIGVTPEECLMIGNDVSEDMVASRLGMRVFLHTDRLINRKGEDVNAYPQGSFDDMIAFIRENTCKEFC